MRKGWLGLRVHFALWLRVGCIVASLVQTPTHASLNRKAAVSAEVVSFETELVAGELKIPVITGLSDAELERTLNAQWEREIKGFVDVIRAEAEAFHKEMGEEVRHWLPFQAYVDFKIGYLDERFVSLPIVYYSYTGGAHGLSFQESANVDLAEGLNLTLEDLFVPGYDFCTVIQTEVKRQRAANADWYFDETMAETVILPHHPFYLTPQGVVVYFGLYEIAPYSTGIPEFVIPYDYLWDGLKPEIRAIVEAE
ncbi:MAG: DUF3298 and DUF4163 domain-containing protein [Firmicutes bacterium]|nr:DUF3298 and DUF4163 domain-containing protein [Bacillota bacterium]